MSTPSAAAKFDPARAAEYAEQSRIALAGYDACHDLAACMLASAIPAEAHAAQVLVAGAGGTAREIAALAGLAPGWRFTAVDPSRPMLDLASANVAAAGLDARVTTHLGYVDDLPADARFDGATLIGVLHHVAGDGAKAALLRSISRRLKPGAPLVVAGNYRRYAEHPRLLSAWAQRWRMHGATPEEVARKLATILRGADLPHPRMRCMRYSTPPGSASRCDFSRVCSGGHGSRCAAHERACRQPGPRRPGPPPPATAAATSRAGASAARTRAPRGANHARRAEPRSGRAHLERHASMTAPGELAQSFNTICAECVSLSVPRVHQRCGSKDRRACPCSRR